MPVPPFRKILGLLYHRILECQSYPGLHCMQKHFMNNQPLFPWGTGRFKLLFFRSAMNGDLFLRQFYIAIICLDYIDNMPTCLQGRIHNTVIDLTYHFPSGKLVKAFASIGFRPYFSFASAIARIRKAMFRARFRMVWSPSSSFSTSSAVKPCTIFQ